MTEASAKPAVLVVPQRHDLLARVLEETFEVHRYWEVKDDPEPFLAGSGQRIEACTVGGPFVPPIAFLERLPRLGLMTCVSVGFENVPQDWCAAHGVAVTAGKEVNADDVADHAVALLLAARRRILAGDADLRAGTWVVHGRPRSRSVASAVIGIVGLGAIGRTIAHRMEAFGPKILWWGPRPKPDAPYPRADSLLDLARDCDVLVIASSADKGDYGMIDRAVMEALGPEGLLVNIARGRLVDEDAMIAALKDGRLGAAALDVFAEEPSPAARWADVPNTVLTTHMAGATQEATDKLWAQAQDNLARFFDGRPLATPLNGLTGRRALVELS